MVFQLKFPRENNSRLDVEIEKNNLSLIVLSLDTSTFIFLIASALLLIFRNNDKVQVRPKQHQRKEGVVRKRKKLNIVFDQDARK